MHSFILTFWCVGLSLCLGCGSSANSVSSEPGKDQLDKPCTKQSQPDKAKKPCTKKGSADKAKKPCTKQSQADKAKKPCTKKSSADKAKKPCCNSSKSALDAKPCGGAYDKAKTDTKAPCTATANKKAEEEQSP